MSRNSKPAKSSREMRSEYDFTQAVRGKYVKRFPHDAVMVTLAPDVAAAFPDAAAVNGALRVLLSVAKNAKLKAAKKATRAA